MQPFIFLDTETTGHNPDIDKIIEIGAIKWQDGKILDRFESLFNPGVPIPYEITLLTGITNEDVRDAPQFKEKRDEIAEFIGDLPIVGHNIQFDTGFLHSHHVPAPPAAGRGTNLEIDTCILARMLLPNESSYSLEVVMRHHGLPLRESHRAMADTETTLDFFIFLLEKIREIPKELHEDIRRVLDKSGWWGKEIFEEMMENKNARKQEVRKEIGRQEAGEDGEKADTKAGAADEDFKIWAPATTETFLSEERTIIEAGGIPDFKIMNEPLVIAYRSNPHKEKIQTAAQQHGKSTAELLSPSRYLSPKKLHNIITARELTDGGTQFLIKMLLWEHSTQTGRQDELRLDREEYGLFDILADHSGEDIYWIKAIESAEKADIIFLHQQALSENGLTLKNRTLIITEAALLEDELTQAASHHYSVSTLAPYFKEKAEILFGLAGIFYEKYGGREGSEDLMLTPHLLQTLEWGRIRATIENLPECKKKQEILAALDDPAALRWISSFAEQLTINIVPREVAAIFAQATANYKKIALHDGTLTLGGDDTYLRNILGLNASWKLVREPYANGLEIIPKQDLPYAMSAEYFSEVIKLYRELIAEHKGRLLLLVNSRKAVEATFQALLNYATEAGVHLLGVGISGGAGKTCALFKENPDNSVLIATPRMLSHLDEIQDGVQAIAIQKIAFDFPNNPLVLARTAHLQSGFGQYSLPRAVLSFKSLLAKLDGHSAGKKCYLLDSRLWTKDYGKWFV